MDDSDIGYFGPPDEWLLEWSSSWAAYLDPTMPHTRHGREADQRAWARALKNSYALDWDALRASARAAFTRPDPTSILEEEP